MGCVLLFRRRHIHWLIDWTKCQRGLPPNSYKLPKTPTQPEVQILEEPGNEVRGRWSVIPSKWRWPSLPKVPVFLGVVDTLERGSKTNGVAGAHSQISTIIILILILMTEKPWTTSLQLNIRLSTYLHISNIANRSHFEGPRSIRDIHYSVWSRRIRILVPHTNSHFAVG